MNLEYVIVKIRRRKASKNVQVSNKMVSQMNVHVATDNVTSQCAKSSDDSYIYSYSFLKYVEEIRGIPVE